jgi:hypothetical protein
LTGYTVYVEQIEEQVVPGKRLGRNVRHDSRNRLYPHQATGRELTSQLWPRLIAILDQGDVGSCTGNMMTGGLGSDPLISVLPPAHPELNEALALKIYSGAETLDGDGPYPPQDNGSTGPSVAQVAKTMGLISGYRHCFTLNDMLDALEDGPVGIGINWYDSMDSPSSSGLVAISPDAAVRGGHEVLGRGKDTADKLLHFDNSWGTSFGVKGSFDMSYDTMSRLLGEQGDVTVLVPLNQPAPVPVPAPTPTPPPVPVPVPDANPDDVALGGHALGVGAPLRRRRPGGEGPADLAARARVHVTNCWQVCRGYLAMA